MLAATRDVVSPGLCLGLSYTEWIVSHSKFVEINTGITVGTVFHIFPADCCERYRKFEDNPKSSFEHLAKLKNEQYFEMFLSIVTASP